MKRDKTDAADAVAICEAVSRPSMRFVAVKTPEQQARLMQHRVRDLLLRQRTQAINALRAHPAEFGLVAAQGREGLAALLAILADVDDAHLRGRAASANAVVGKLATGSRPQLGVPPETALIIACRRGDDDEHEVRQPRVLH